MLFIFGPNKEEQQFERLIKSWLKSKSSEQNLKDAINLLNKIDIDSNKEKSDDKYSYNVRFHAAAQNASRLYERLALAKYQTDNNALSHECQLMAELRKQAGFFDFNFDSAFSILRIKKSTLLDTQFMKKVHAELTQANTELTQKLKWLPTSNKDSLQEQKDLLFGNTRPGHPPKNNKQTRPNNHKQTRPNDHREDLRTIIKAITDLKFNLHYGFGSKIKNGRRVSRGAAEIYNIALEALTHPSSANISDTFDKIHNILGTKTQPRWTLFGLGQRDQTTTELYQKLEDIVCAKRRALNSENESSLISRIMR